MSTGNLENSHNQARRGSGRFGGRPIRQLTSEERANQAQAGLQAVSVEDDAVRLAPTPVVRARASSVERSYPDDEEFDQDETSQTDEDGDDEDDYDDEEEGYYDEDDDERTPEEKLQRESEQLRHMDCPGYTEEMLATSYRTGMILESMIPKRLGSIQTGHPAEFEWLVDRTFAVGEQILLAGPEKSLKTTLAVALAVSLATGLPFLGITVPEPRRVLYYSLETSTPAFERIVHLIADALVIRSVRQLRKRLEDNLIPSYPPYVNLAEREGQDAVKHLLQLYRPEVVFLDPVSKCGAPADADSNQNSMAGFLGRLRVLFAPYQVTVVLQAHCTKPTAKLRRPLKRQDVAGTALTADTRAWMLVNHRQAWSGSSTDPHLLNLVIGGNARNSEDTYRLDVIASDRRFRAELVQTPSRPRAEAASPEPARPRPTLPTNQQRIMDVLTELRDWQSARQLRERTSLNNVNASAALEALVDAERVQQRRGRIRGKEVCLYRAVGA